MRLNLVVEGATEERFVKDVLAPHLWMHQVYATPLSVKTGRHRGVDIRGGLMKYAHLQNSLRNWMRAERGADVRFSTMVDLYRLPADFPGRDAAARMGNPYERVAAIEGALAEDVGDRRFLPYIQVHEFEALLLSDPRQFDWQFVEHERPIESLVALAGSVASPELIDDGPETAPSKRIIAAIPGYKRLKASAAPLIAAKIGLETMRAKCPHFHEWA